MKIDTKFDNVQKELEFISGHVYLNKANRMYYLAYGYERTLINLVGGNPYDVGYGFSGDEHNFIDVTDKVKLTNI
jgi:hypothetical protein